MTKVHVTGKSPADFERNYRVDVIIVGGGVAGTVAAIASARHGLRTLLLHNRPFLGGPSSPECCVSSDGRCVNGASEYINRNSRETGILEELKREALYRAANGWSNHWSMVMREWAERESNLTMLLNTEVYGVTMAGNIIREVTARTIGSELNITAAAPLFIDCSGDSFVGFAAGAEYRMGREGRGEFGESLAPERPDMKTMGSSIAFRARDTGRAVPFIPPDWAMKFTSDDQLPYRQHNNPRSGYWWLEYGGEQDTVADNESIYRTLLSALYGLWDHVKNHGDHGADNYVIDWISSVPGKRESRRLCGDYLLTQNDVTGRRDFPDAVAYGGWPIDLHPPEGIFGKSHPGSTPPFVFPGIYQIPFRCLYSRNIGNLMMAGRNISVSHVALGTTRVMATCALCGEAVGTAAFLVSKYGKSPRSIGLEHIDELQEMLGAADMVIPGRLFPVSADLLAGNATTRASSSMPLRVEYADGELPLMPPDRDDAVYDPCDVPPEDRSRAQMFPVSGDHVDAVIVRLNSYLNAPVSLAATLHAAAGVGDFTPGAGIMSRAVAVVMPGLDQPVRFEFDIAVCPGKLYWINLEPLPGLAVVTGSRYLPGLYLKQDGCYIDSRNFCFEVLPEQQIFGADNVLGVGSRAYSLPEMWISDPALPLPQELTVELRFPVLCGRIELIFDTNLDRQSPDGAPAECVRDYELAVFSGGKWRRVAEVAGNYHRRRIHEFSAVEIERIRVVVTAVNGDFSARIYTVRAFR